VKFLSLSLLGVQKIEEKEGENTRKHKKRRRKKRSLDPSSFHFRESACV